MSALLGVPVTLKLELLQRSGSFKPRGVAMKMLALARRGAPTRGSLL